MSGSETNELKLKIRELEDALSAADGRAVSAETRAATAEGKLAVAEAQIKEANVRVSAAEATMAKHTAHETSREGGLVTGLEKQILTLEDEVKWLRSMLSKTPI